MALNFFDEQESKPLDFFPEQETPKLDLSFSEPEQPNSLPVADTAGKRFKLGFFKFAKEIGQAATTRDQREDGILKTLTTSTPGKLVSGMGNIFDLASRSLLFVGQETVRAVKPELVAELNSKYGYLPSWSEIVDYGMEKSQVKIDGKELTFFPSLSKLGKQKYDNAKKFVQDIAKDPIDISKEVITSPFTQPQNIMKIGFDMAKQINQSDNKFQTVRKIVAHNLTPNAKDLIDVGSPEEMALRFGLDLGDPILWAPQMVASGALKMLNPLLQFGKKVASAKLPLGVKQFFVKRAGQTQEMLKMTDTFERTTDFNKGKILKLHDDIVGVIKDPKTREMAVMARTNKQAFQKLPEPVQRYISGLNNEIDMKAERIATLMESLGHDKNLINAYRNNKGSYLTKKFKVFLDKSLKSQSGEAGVGFNELQQLSNEQLKAAETLPDDLFEHFVDVLKKKKSSKPFSSLAGKISSQGELLTETAAGKMRRTLIPKLKSRQTRLTKRIDTVNNQIRDIDFTLANVAKTPANAEHLKHLETAKKLKQGQVQRFGKRIDDIGKEVETIANYDLPEAYRLALGQVNTAEFVYPWTMAKQDSLVTKLEPINQLQKQKGKWWFDKPTNVSVGGRTESAVKMPTNKLLGNMSGKYIHPALAEDFASILNVEQESAGFLRAMKGLQSFLDWKAISVPTSAWKTAKVSSPSVLIGNIMSNIGIGDMNGLSFSKLPGRISSALKDIKSGGQFSKRAQELAISGGFVKAELMGSNLQKFFTKDLDTLLTKKLNLEGTITKLFKGLAAPVKGYLKGFGSIYENSEFIFKIGLAQEKMAQGMFNNIDDALRFADKAFINYKSVSKATQIARRSPIGVPFITFYQNIIPQILKTVKDNPLKIYKWRAIARTISNASGASMGYTPEQTQQVLQSLGQREGLFLPSHILMPGFSEDGKYRTVDIERWTPTGWLGDTNYRAVSESIPPALSVSGWGVDLYNLIYQSIDPITGNRIPKEFAGREVPKAIGKTFTPPILSYYAPEIANLAMSDTLRESERNRLLRQKTIQGLTGLKLKEQSPSDVKKIELLRLKRKQRELKEFKGRQRFIEKSKAGKKGINLQLRDALKKQQDEFKRKLKQLRGF